MVVCYVEGGHVESDSRRRDSLRLACSLSSALPLVMMGMVLLLTRESTLSFVFNCAAIPLIDGKT